ncbi:hypothetical protein [Spongiimicrobium sp. 3-5]|uniref:hypothetical protein n=1 Tax=Spongiimicrobium sp. 3-5 TaxID=3332596 RepID=UPI00397F689B
MKNTGLLFLFLILSSCSSDDNLPLNGDTGGQTTFLGEVVWAKNYGGTGEDTGQEVISTSDGGYVILGYSNSMDGDLVGKTTDVNDYWLIKLDADGNLQWSKTYGGSKDDRGQSVVQTSDNGFAIVGYAMSDDGDGSNNEGFHDNWILKLDVSGNIEWERSFGFSGHDHSYDVVQTADGGFFFVGFLDITASQGAGGAAKGDLLTRHGVGEFWGTKLDAEGNLQWRRYFGGTNNDRAYGVTQTDDGGFVMTGSSESEDFDISNGKGSYDYWAVKITGSGDLVWESSFGGAGIDKAYDVTKTNDNAYVLVGNTFSTDLDVSKNNGESDVWLVKIDDNGELLWEKTFGGTQFDAAQSVVQASDGGFLIAGNSKSADLDADTNAGENDFWIIKTDGQGELIWQHTYGGTAIEFGFDAIETTTGGIVFVGETASQDFPNLENKGATDLVVLKIE